MKEKINRSGRNFGAVFLWVITTVSFGLTTGAQRHKGGNAFGMGTNETLSR
jgi:hypothetical protein